jgi:hypothetical protein
MDRDLPYSLSLLSIEESATVLFERYHAESITAGSIYDLVIIPAFTTEDMKIALAQNRAVCALAK